MSELQLPLCAVFFSFLLLVVYFSKKRVDLVENKIYSVMLICTFLDSVIVSIERLLVRSGNLESISSGVFQILRITNKIDYAVLILLTTCVFIYTILITYPSAKEHIKKWFSILLSLDFLFYIINLFLEVEFICQASIISVGGSAPLFTYVICGIYLASSVIVTLFAGKNITIRHIPILSMIFLFIFLMIIFSISPYVMIISIVLVFVSYLIYFTMENPDIHMIEQLNIAKSEAEKANHAKTDFLSSMSHEIRTPLNAIVGFSECISDAKTLEEAKENAKDIVTASDTLLEIVNGVLDISKIEAGKLEIKRIPYSPRELFDVTAKLILPRIREKNLEFRLHVSSDLPDYLYGDPTNLKKAIMNVLTNACKYTERGFVDFSVQCVKKNEVCRLIISVEDTGRGIKKDAMNQLFTKFQRLEEDRNTTLEGTGLGLAITKQILNLMGGNIVVQSVYGEGSKFTIVLDEAIVSYHPTSSFSKGSQKLDLSSKKILVVDDNPLNLKVAKRLLESLFSATVLLADSGSACLEMVRHENYDLILMDIMMPRMDGVATLKSLRELDDFITPVVALTADAVSSMREKYLKLGFDEYLTKPIEKEELYRVLQFVFSRQLAKFDDLPQEFYEL